MSVHSQDSDNEELGAIGGKKPISRQASPFSRPSSVVFMENLLKQQSEQAKQQTEYLLQQQSERMQQQENRLMQRMDSIKDQSETTNSTLTDLSARMERLERASPDLNPVELRTNPSDGNFAFHAVPTQVTAPLATRPPQT